MKDDTVRRLIALDEQYIVAVNEAIEQDRDDLIRDLVDSYPDDAAKIMNSAA